MPRSVASLAANNDTWPNQSNIRQAVLQQPRILIVDDEPSIREFVDRVLRGAGYTTIRAGNGEEALAFAERVGGFDLLVTDLVMPRMGGTELVQRLRRARPDLKVLYLTGYADRLFEEKGTLWAAEAFLEKPASVGGLLEAVALLMDGHLPSKPHNVDRRRPYQPMA